MGLTHVISRWADTLEARQQRREQGGQRRTKFKDLASLEKTFESLEKAMGKEGPSASLWKKLEKSKEELNRRFRVTTGIWGIGLIGCTIALMVVYRLSVPLIVAILFCTMMVVIRVAEILPITKRYAKLFHKFPVQQTKPVVAEIKKEFSKVWMWALLIFFGGSIGCAIAELILYQRWHIKSRLLIGATIVYFNLGLVILFALKEMRKKRAGGTAMSIQRAPEKTPTSTKVITENPPAANLAKAKRLESSALTVNTFGNVLLLYVTIAVFTPALHKDLYAFVAGGLGIVGFVLFVLSSRWNKRAEALTEPIPLVSVTWAVKAEGHSIEMAFQLPTEFNRPDVCERLQIATRAILRTFKPEGLQETLEAGLYKDATELKIPVFRIQILAIDKTAVPVPQPVKERDKAVYI